MKNNIHILILPSWYPSKLNNIRGSFFREQALALSNAGYQIGVITVDLRSLKHWKTIASETHGIEYENDMGINTLRFKTMFWFPRMPRLISQLSLAGGIAAFEQYLIKFGKPDLVHVHSCLYMGLLAVHIKNKYGIDYILTEHSSGYFRGLYNNYQIDITRKVLRNSSQLITVSSKMSDFLSKNIYNEKKWNVIPNIVDSVFFSRDILSREEDKPFRYINVAFMNENKKQINLIKAFKLLIDQGIHDIELILVGDGEKRTELENYVSTNNIKNIKFLGMVSRNNVASLMAESNCFLLSSEFETFGVVAIEALASGLPVISTRCGGPEDIVDHTNGLLVERNNIEKIMVAMRSVKDNYQSKYDRESIRAACFRQYSEKSVVEMLGMYYKKYA